MSRWLDRCARVGMVAGVGLMLQPFWGDGAEVWVFCRGLQHAVARCDFAAADGRVMSFLECRDLVKTFADGTRAVQGIDLRCGEGEFAVLLGPSGCGKTTTLRMVAGLEKPTAGQIVLAGADITDRSPAERDVGVRVSVLRALSAPEGRGKHRLSRWRAWG